MNLTDILSNASLFELPEFLSGTSAWDRHIPFAFLIIEILRPKCLVELGTHKGDSYLAFCQAVRKLSCGTRCFAVDSWQGEEHAGLYGEEVYTELIKYHSPRYSDFSRLMRANFDSAATQFEQGSIDLLHIDGLHTYDAVRRDFETWRPKLSQHSVVLLHDTQVQDRDFGVWRLWAEIANQFPHFEFHHGSGLGIAAVGGAVPEGVRSLFNLEIHEQQILRQVCESLGYRAALYGANQAMTSQLSMAKGELERASTELAELHSHYSAINEALILEKNALQEKATSLCSTVEDLRKTLSMIERSRVWRVNCFIRRLFGLA